ncbi:hypothetical protein EON81_15440 [bacterium]|nr:MAG: hypothetical protein EON81_15440 [bacterium]
MALSGIDPNHWHFEARLELYGECPFGKRTDLFFWDDPRAPMGYMIWPVAAFRPDGSELVEMDRLMEAMMTRFVIIDPDSAKWLLENGLGPGFVFGIFGRPNGLGYSYEDPFGLVQVIRLHPDWPPLPERDAAKRVKRRRHRPPPEIKP